jgi:hypothetical protein
MKGQAFAAGTEVSAEKSRAELETILNRYGAEGFAYATRPRSARVEFLARGRRIRFDVALPDPEDREFTHVLRRGAAFATKRTTDQAKAAYDAEVRRLWRALVLAVKAKLEMVQSGLSMFDAEFMSQIVMPDGRTVGEVALPQIDAAYAGRGPGLLLLGAGGEA